MNFPLMEFLLFHLQIMTVRDKRWSSFDLGYQNFMIPSLPSEGLCMDSECKLLCLASYLVFEKLDRIIPWNPKSQEDIEVSFF